MFWEKGLVDSIWSKYKTNNQKFVRVSIEIEKKNRETTHTRSGRASEAHMRVR